VRGVRSIAAQCRYTLPVAVNCCDVHARVDSLLCFVVYAKLILSRCTVSSIAECRVLTEYL
jgi:hypothetical protein